MSNIAKTIDYLEKNRERFLQITNQETNAKVGKTAIFLDDIPEHDLYRYIKQNLGVITKPTLVWVELRAKQGASSRKVDAYKVEITNNQMEQSTSLPVVIPTAPPLVVAPQNDIFGGLGQIGIGFPQIMEMHHNSSRLKDKEEQLLDLKEDHRDLKQKFNLLEIDNRSLLTKLSTSEARQEMAVMMVKAENKSFFDSDAFAKIMDKAPELLGSFVALKTGGTVPGGALGNPDLSETKNSFIEFVSDNLTDAQINYLGSIAGRLNNASFMNALTLLIQQHASN